MRTGLSVAEARAAVLEACPLLGSETVPALQGLGRVLAESVHSGRTLPPADCSAMDGYAVRCADLSGASATRPVRLAVAFEVAAGSPSDREVGAGEAARIFTGAAVPAGADAVVRQEDAERTGSVVAIARPAVPAENIRSAGEDVRRGDLVLAPGDRLLPAQIGLLASLGRTLVSVRRRPRVAILAGGDELVEPDASPGGGRIVASNSYALAAQCRLAGAEPCLLGIARDDPGDLERHLRSGLGADCLVSTAGVSVGDHDHVRPVLEKLGCRIEFWGVHMKPGYPVAFGRFEADPGTLMFALPGNPVSAMVTFEQFVRPALLKMAGRVALARPEVTARIAHSLEKKAGRQHFVRVALARRAGEVWATSTGNQSSGVLRSLALAQGLLVFPAEATRLAEGDPVRVQVLDSDFFAALSADDGG